MRNFAYVSPASLAQASAAALEKGSVIKAGGIDLLDMMKADIVRPERLVNLLAVRAPGLREITEKSDGLHLGALCTLADLAAHRAVPAVLRDAAGLAATPQIRNVATLGGNLAQRPRCWYLRSATFPCARKGGDICYAQKGENKYHALFDNLECAVVHASSLAGPLVALDAVVVTTQRQIPIEKFFVPTTVDITREHVLAPGEIVTHVRVPAGPAAWRNAYREAGERDSSDWQLVSASVALDLDGKAVRAARIALGGVAAVPYRSPAAENVLAGKSLDATAIARAAEAAFASAKPLDDNAYKVPLGKVMLRRALLAAAGLPETGA